MKEVGGSTTLRTPDRGRVIESPLSVVYTLHISLGTRGARAPLLYSRSAVVVGSLAVDAFSRQLST